MLTASGIKPREKKMVKHSRNYRNTNLLIGKTKDIKNNRIIVV